MKRLLTSVWLAVLLTAANTAYAEDDASEIEYAERMPRVAKSLLLDITALTGGGLVAVGERGHVVYSAHGTKWHQADVVPTRSTLTAVTENDGRLWAAGHDTVIIASDDGGLTWTLQYFDPERQQSIMDIHFFDQQHGMAIGAYGLALVTSDGGETWDDHMVNEEEWHNNAILNLGDQRLMVAGEAGFGYRSEDGGESWAVLEMPYPGSMFGALEISDDCILMYGLRGTVQHSCDFGDHWEELNTGTESGITGAVFHQKKSILVGNSGLILIRDNGGPFRAEYHSSGVDFAAIATLGDGRFVLVGEDGVHHFPDRAGSRQ